MLGFAVVVVTLVFVVVVEVELLPQPQVGELDFVVVAIVLQVLRAFGIPQENISVSLVLVANF